jgi:hypothetical protein
MASSELVDGNVKMIGLERRRNDLTIHLLQLIRFSISCHPLLY